MMRLLRMAFPFLFPSRDYVLKLEDYPKKTEQTKQIEKPKEVEKIDNYSTMNNETAYTILNKLMEFEDILINAASRELPHMVANYLYELASLFHSYYSKEKIVTEDIEYTKERLAFIKAIKIVMNNAANILGLILREEM